MTHWSNDTTTYKKEEPKGHPNASILMEIAKEAAINTEYWKEFGWIGKASPVLQIFSDQNDLYNAISVGSHEIRRKPSTIRIGNYDVPEFYEAFIHVFNENTVVIRFESEDSAGLMLKALKELAGKQ